MRVLDGDQFLVRIFPGECDRWQHTPLSRVLLERLRAGLTCYSNRRSLDLPKVRVTRGPRGTQHVGAYWP